MDAVPVVVFLVVVLAILGLAAAFQRQPEQPGSDLTEDQIYKIESQRERILAELTEAWREKLGARRSFNMAVHGESHYCDAVARCKGGEEVELRREPSNPYDSNAIAVLLASNGEMLGYIPRNDASAMAHQMDSGSIRYAAIVGRVTGGYGQKLNRGIVLTVFELPAVKVESA
jgi:hypothetical protein